MAVIVAVVFATVPVISGFGQPATNSPIQTLSLAQAKEIAFEKNWDLLAAKTGIESATAQLICREGISQSNRQSQPGEFRDA